MIIAFNQANDDGGGVRWFMASSKVVFEDVTITGNRANNEWFGFSHFWWWPTILLSGIRLLPVRKILVPIEVQYRVRNNADTVVFEGTVLVNQGNAVNDGVTAGLDREYSWLI